MTIKFNPDIHFLGKLCDHNHEWENTGKSLRYKSRHHLCALCVRIQRKRQTEDVRFKGKSRKSAIEAKCPGCGKIHKDVKGIFYIGKGMPRFYCNSCKIELSKKADRSMAVGF